MWPGVPLPLPCLLRREHYRLEPSKRALIGSPGHVEASGRRGEIYLELSNLDLTNPDAILAFANSYGVFADVVTDVDDLRDRLHYLTLARAMLHGEDTDLEDAHDILLASLGEAKYDELYEERYSMSSLEAFRYCARCVRDLTTAWRVVNGELAADEATFDELWVESVGTEAHRYVDAREMLAYGLTTLLAEFRPSVEGGGRVDALPKPDLDRRFDAYHEHPQPLTTPIEPDAGPSHEDVRIDAREAPAGAVGLAEICALELFNHIVGGEVYRRCQNENCERLFVRQYGRAEHGQSRRQGVMYCSASCASATTQRAYRRRKAVERARSRTGPAASARGTATPR